MHRSPVSPARVVSTLEDHTVGSRQSDRYQEWRAALHHFYEPFPLAEHIPSRSSPVLLLVFPARGHQEGRDVARTVRYRTVT